MLVLMATIAGCGGPREAVAPPVPANAVAVIDGTPLLMPEFEERYMQTIGSREAAADDSLAEYQDFLDRYVNFRVKVLSAQKRGLAEDSAVVAELAQYRQQLARPYLVDGRVTEPVVQDLFEKQQEEVRASHILVSIGETATPADTARAYALMQAYVDSVNAGMPFSEVARKYSQDPSARQNLGDLGYFTGGRMIFDFERYAYATPVGEQSPIFRTRFGYHVLRVDDRRPRTRDIQARHILIRTEGPDTTMAYAKMDSVRQAILAGADFGDAARAISDDPGSGANGGDLGSFGVGRMVPPFEKAAFGLENIGDISEIVRTRFGYHIIQLTGRADLPTYDESYNELKQLAQRLPRLQQRTEALGRELREQEGFMLDTTAVLNAIAYAPSDSLTAYLIAQQVTVPSDSGLTRTKSLPTPGASLATEVARIGDVSYTLENVLDEAKRTPGQVRFDEPMDVVEYIDDYTAGKAIDLVASRLENRDPDFAKLMEQYLDGILLFRVMEDSVWNAAAADSAGMLAYYEANKAEYNFPQRRRVLSYVASSDSLLRDIANRIEGDSLDTAMLMDMEGVRVDTTFLAGTTNSVYDRALNIGIGETVGPIRYQQGFILLLADGTELPRPKTFTEARAEVLSGYQQILEEAWVARLREEFDVQTFPAKLNAAFAAERAEAMPAEPAMN